jgi:acyl-CoA synthetase (NDP forming)
MEFTLKSRNEENKFVMENTINSHPGSNRIPGRIASNKILREAGRTVTEPVLTQSPAEAVSIAPGFGYPVVLKIVSADIIHKSDSGGVVTGLADPDSVARAYDEIMAAIRRNHTQARIDGISVQPQASPGVEVIIGHAPRPANSARR